MSGLLARVWHKVLGDLLEEVSGEDPGLAARRVVDNGAWLREHRESERKRRAEAKAFGLCPIPRDVGFLPTRTEVTLIDRDPTGRIVEVKHL